MLAITLLSLMSTAHAESAEAAAAATALADSGDILLEQATRLLASGDYAAALQIAVPALSVHPDQAAAFEVIIDLAADQLQRTDTTAAAVAAPEPERIRNIGVELGSSTGIRLEKPLERELIDAVGLRFGGLITDDYGLQLSAYVDWKLGEGAFQLETPLGVQLYDGWPYMSTGVSLQYDPPSAFQANLGMMFTQEMLVPEMSIAFLW